MFGTIEVTESAISCEVIGPTSLGFFSTDFLVGPKHGTIRLYPPVHDRPAPRNLPKGKVGGR